MLTVVEKVIFLQNVDVFSEVSTENLALVATIGHEVEYSAGERIYEELAPSDAMYVVIEGEVRLHRGDVNVTRAVETEAFGTWSLFDDEHRVTSATAVRRTVLLCVSKDDFIELLADNVEITQGVLKAVVRRLRSLLGRVGGSERPSGG
jgi:CRP-like cAMP-binding protein